jgi:hypothetical protein
MNPEGGGIISGCALTGAVNEITQIFNFGCIVLFLQ